MIVALQPIPRGFHGGCKVIPIKASLPFAESGSGRYAHRVRSATLNELCGHQWFALRLWCGMSLNLSNRPHRSYVPGRFLAEPTRPICATCEGRAIGAGQLGARVIAGREVMFSPRPAWGREP